jgi:L-seryl-tRNA(Ser) seleniumtransferase
LRAGTPPIVARVEHDRVLLDPRTVDPADDARVAAAVRAAAVPGS